jgi:hypothetical protein
MKKPIGSMDESKLETPIGPDLADPGFVDQAT